MYLKNISMPKRFSVLALMLIVGSSFAFAADRIHADRKKVIAHWTSERMAAAIPRDLVIDERGLGYLRRPNGSFEPYGHSTIHGRLDGSQLSQTPRRPSGGSGETTPPTVTNMLPAEESIIGSSQLFSATVTDDASGIKSVAFVVTYPNGTTTQSFNPSVVSNGNYEISLQGFSDGNWSWHVVAKDGASRGGNTTVSAEVHFAVDSGGSSAGGGSSGGTGGGYIVVNSEWTNGGGIQTAAGRIYFEMPGNAKRKGPWTGYVCSGTVADDSTIGRSIIITASHCVYDDVNKSFARNVLFIPNQAATTSNGTDQNCNNDPLGCWVLSFGVVDVNWTQHTFPDNIEWDYAFYVVDDQGAHLGTATSSDSLDVAVGALTVNFSMPYYDDSDPDPASSDFTHALGYSYSVDPNFMYCAEDMTTEGTVNWWLPSCELSGGSSGGSWVQPMNTNLGSGPIISVNSWGYTTAPGMAGPMLNGNSSASCIFSQAKDVSFGSVPTTDGDAGIAIDTCPP